MGFWEDTKDAISGILVKVEIIARVVIYTFIAVLICAVIEYVYQLPKHSVMYGIFGAAILWEVGEWLYLWIKVRRMRNKFRKELLKKKEG